MSTKDKRTRLEKLLCILEDSKNDQTLRVAAQKIAHVALQHPQHVSSVLRQVHHKLCSKEWKARVYAGEALAELATRIEHARAAVDSDTTPVQTRSHAVWNFSLATVLLTGRPLVSGTADSASEHEVLSFEDVRRRLRAIKVQYALVEECAGEEGTPRGSVKQEPESNEDRIEHGDGVPGKRRWCDMGEQCRSPLAQPSVQSARERNKNKRQARASDKQASGMLESVQTSANVLAMQPSANAAATATAAAVSAAEAEDDERESERIAQGAWPFQRIADQLVTSLLDPNWHVRHGAAVGLRQLLKLQAASAGVSVRVLEPLSGWRRAGGTGPVTRAEMSPAEQAQVSAANYEWLQDTMAVLLVLLVLDRFADYHNDSATAPVRETAAQALAFAAAASPQHVRHLVLEQLCSMQSSKVWEVRHGGMMCIKYMMAVEAGAAGALTHRMLPVLMAGMRDGDDDVRAAAVHACVPLAHKFAQQGSGTVRELIACLWQLLPSFDEVSPAPASVLQLLGLLTSHILQGDAPCRKSGLRDAEACADASAELPAQKERTIDVDARVHDSKEQGLKDGVPRPADSDQTTVSREGVLGGRGPPSGQLPVSVKLEEDGDAEQATEWRTPPVAQSDVVVDHLNNLRTSMPLLWPFFNHCSTQVQVACASCCLRLCEAILEQPASALAGFETILQTMLRLAYQGFVAAVDSDFASSCWQLVHLLLKSMPAAMLAFVLDAATLYAMMELPCTATGSPLPATRLLRFPPSSAGAVGPGAADSLGSLSSFKFGDQNPEDAESGSVARRVECGRICGLAASMSAGVDKDSVTSEALLLTAHNFRNLIATYLCASSALQRSFGALVMMFWMNLHPDPSVALPESLRDPLFKALEDAPTMALQDTSLALQVMHANLNGVLEAFRSSGSPLQLPPEAPLHTVTHSYATDILNGLDAAYRHIAQPQRQACRAAIANVEAVERGARLRVAATAAAARAAWGDLPDKVSTVIQPLMAGLKNIPEAALQREVVASALAGVITKCMITKPAAVDKILSHIRAFACAPQAAGTATAPSAKGKDRSNSSLPSNLTCGGASNSASPSATSSPRSGTAASHAQPFCVCASAMTPEMICRAGAEAVLQHLVSTLGAALPSRLPQLWSMLTAPVVTLAASYTASRGPEAAALQSPAPTDAVDAMRLLQCVAPSLHVQLHRELAKQLPCMMVCMVHLAPPLDATVCDGIVGLSLAEPHVHLESAVTVLLPSLEPKATSGERMAAIQLLARLLAASEALMLALLPYAAMLAVPALTLMTDPELPVRSTAAAAFGRLVSLLPLAVNLPPPELRMLDPELRKKRQGDLLFLEQLMDTQSIAAFDPPELPAGVTLRGYQREGVSWLSFLQRFGLHGVLADDMGLGKTVQTLTIIVCTMSASTHHSGGVTSISGSLPSLIVCPATLLGHWVSETKRYFGHTGLQAVRYQGPTEQRLALQRQIGKGSGLLVVASYETVRADIQWLAGLRFQYCVLDEGHIIRNSKTKVTKACKQIVANHRLVLSGTPVQNNVTELWSIFDFLMPGYLGTETDFNSKYRRAATMSKDGRRRGTREKHMNTQLSVLDSLHKQVLPFVLRRTKEQVLHDLPPKIIQDIVCELTPLQRRLYEMASAGTRFAAEAVVGAAQDSNSNGEQTAIFQELQRLRKLCTHPSLVLDLASQPHVQALRASFPSLNTSNPEAVDAELTHIEQSPKLMAFKQLLSNAGIIRGGADVSDDARMSGGFGQHRVLCFAQMKATLDLAESLVLDPEGISYVRLDGDVPTAKRSDIVQQFNTDPTVDVMLLTTAAGCHGLNLTTANVVVFLEHDWNPMKDLQAMDRAHRLGQRRTVTVYRLLTEGTLEEHIMNLQQFKVDVANTVVNADNVALDTMDAGAVLDLMSGRPAHQCKGSTASQKKPQDHSGFCGGGSSIARTGAGEHPCDGQYEEYKIHSFMDLLKKQTGQQQ